MFISKSMHTNAKPISRFFEVLLAFVFVSAMDSADLLNCKLAFVGVREGCPKGGKVKLIIP
jgi:hypothetical protein